MGLGRALRARVERRFQNSLNLIVPMSARLAAARPTNPPEDLLRVSDDVYSAKEIAVLCAVSTQLPLHDAQRVRVAIDSLNNRPLIINGEPLSFY